MAENGTPGAKLNVRQQKFLAALLAAPTVAQAAELAGVGERTGRRYLADPDVRAELAHLQAERMAAVAAQATAAIEEVLEVLRSIAKDQAAPPTARVSAARAVWENAIRTTELVTLEERVRALETVADPKD